MEAEEFRKKSWISFEVSLLGFKWLDNWWPTDSLSNSFDLSDLFAQLVRKQ